jgi:hypothetical protein
MAVGLVADDTLLDHPLANRIISYSERGDRDGKPGPHYPQCSCQCRLPPPYKGRHEDDRIGHRPGGVACPAPERRRIVRVPDVSVTAPPFPGASSLMLDSTWRGILPPHHAGHPGVAGPDVASAAVPPRSAEGREHGAGIGRGPSRSCAGLLDALAASPGGDRDGVARDPLGRDTKRGWRPVCDRVAGLRIPSAWAHYLA